MTVDLDDLKSALEMESPDAEELLVIHEAARLYLAEKEQDEWLGLKMDPKYDHLNSEMETTPNDDLLRECKTILENMLRHRGGYEDKLLSRITEALGE
jgi:hypothetical protein